MAFGAKDDPPTEAAPGAKGPPDRGARGRAGDGGRDPAADDVRDRAGDDVRDRSDDDRRDAGRARLGEPTKRQAVTLDGSPSRSTRDRQREEFGGISWLSTLVGWLAAAGLAAILSGILAAAGAVLAVSEFGQEVSDSTEAETIGLAGGIALLAVLVIAYFFGGYAAGRMARFDGARQGVGVWLWGIVAAVVVAILAAIGGSEFNVLDRLNLPRLPVDSGTLTQGGIIALVASIVVTLGAAVLGGKTGERFHKKVDRVG